jgi:hypothetical protein
VRAAIAGALALSFLLSPPIGEAQSAEPTAAELFLACRQGQFGRLYQVEPETDVERMLRPAIEEFRTRYLLRYVPAGVSRSGWHDIVVTVPSGSFDVRHRRGHEISTQAPGT